MPKPATVFYSWQSDSPSNLNRSFIERALQEALRRINSDASLESAPRDIKLQLDKDTQGVPGSPPIAETILRKIEDCAVFVADLSFVGESKSGFADASRTPRHFPNPNVLIEYGYALRCHSHSRLVGVMNTVYGEPNAESLPFDLRHLRWPITYHLSDSSAADKNARFEDLVRAFIRAIGSILSNYSVAKAEQVEFVPHRSTIDPATFFGDSAELLSDDSRKIVVPSGAKAYLRVYPSLAVSPIGSEFEARELAVNGNLQPMGRVDGWNFDRNIFGAIAYAPPQDGNLNHFTQLFLSREIWGVDAYILNSDRIREWLQSHLKNDSFRYIANGYIEEYFVRALQNYLMFAQSHLQLPLPLKIEAGLIGIKGYSIATINDRFIGKALRPNILWQGELGAYGLPAWQVVAPFFDRTWENCGLQRTAQQQAALVERFTSR